MEEIIQDLQARLMFQEDAIDALTRTLSRQEQLLRELLVDVEELQQQMLDLAPGSPIDLPDETPPPHY